MDPSSKQHQEIHLSNSLESMVVCQKTEQERKPRPQQEEAIECPRCDSINTKFCYYNNYSLTQPRYFCKSCRRYWTKGGTLRNIPVGGGCRKNKKTSLSSPSSYSSFKRSLNDPTIALGPTMTAYYDPYSESFNPISGFENHASSADTFTDRFLENYLNSCRNLQSGFENLATTKEEVFGEQELERRTLWGFPWQINGDGNAGDFDLGRDLNGISSSWPHGLLHSPLM